MQRDFTRIKRLSSWRRIALHAWDSPRDPTVYGNLEVNMRRALAYLEEANRESAQAKATVTHLVVKAIGRALAENPEANAIIARKQIYMRRSVDVYCQVATEGGRDLSGVKVTSVDGKSLMEIAGELATRIDGVRSGRDPGSERSKQVLTRIPHRFLGMLLKAVGFLSYDLLWDLSAFGIEFDQFGGAMVSNVGSFGLGHGLAPLVPISRAPIVLLVGEVNDRPCVENGELAVAPHMTIGATFDHRLIDGHQAGVMAKTVIASVSDPYQAFGPPSRSS